MGLYRPIDLRSKTCSSISSECVIWDGPDIPCLNLCKGDSLEKVTYDLAIEVCKIIDLFNLNGIDTSCLFDVSCKSPTLSDLLQYIINWICDNRSNDGNNPSKEEICNTVSGCVFTFVDCNNNVISLPLYSNDSNNIIVYFITRICELYNQINNINNQITTINTLINDINTQITNIWNEIQFPVTNIDNCIFTGTISSLPGFINYVNSIASNLCSLASGIGFTPGGPYSLTGYVLDCDRLDVNNVPINNLVDLFYFFNTFFSNLCNVIGSIYSEITNINNEVTNINNQLSNCKCDCPKNVYLSIKYAYTYSSGVYNYANIRISVVNLSQLSTMGWSLVSINIPANSLVINDNSTISSLNSSAIISSTSPLVLNLRNVSIYNVNSWGCANIQNIVNGVVVPDQNITLEVPIEVTLSNGTISCTSYHHLTLFLKHCVCGYVESVSFIEGRTSNLNIINR